MKAIVNANLILEEGIVFDGVVLVENGLIAAYGEKGAVEIPADAEIFDAGGKYVAPGFVDIHNHGGGGELFDTNPAAAAKHFLAHGETTILPTLYYDLSYEDMIAAVKRIQDVIANEKIGAAIGGIYMEGPYMNPKYGASPEKNKWRGEINMEHARSVAETAGDTVRVWAVAPEREGIADFVKMAREVNPTVKIAFGHTEATPAQVFALKKYGLSIQTHCTNATHTVGYGGGTRSCGPDEACFYDPEIYAEVICDHGAIHVHPDMLRLIYRIKGEDRVVLITDCTNFAGPSKTPDALKHCFDLNFDANGGIAGSKLTMDVACFNMMRHTTVGLCQVFKMASLNPARAVGLDDTVGSISVGKRANLVVTDDKINISAVMLDGEIVSGGF
ncbi:MAG: N-acetylglucosamine-6-phosphate deacetylase [Clostridia bacterium]|nr:N-acetylglucosamine-6-phosphate deacetylase [Clostridia bacterium]